VTEQDRESGEWAEKEGRSGEDSSTKPEKAALVAVSTNVLLTAAKFVLAAFTASLALLAEAFHSFADIGSSLAVFLALRAERVNAESRGPRLARLLGRNPQRVVAVFIGLFLLGVAVSMFRKVLEPNEIAVAYPVPAAIGMLVLALFSFLLSRFERAVGERTGSTALLADGIHARVDMFGSLLVAIALLGESISLRVDQFAAGVISFFILVQAVNVFVTVIRDSLREEKGANYFYPEWLVRSARDGYRRARGAVYARVAHLLGIRPEDAGRDDKVGKVVSAAALLILFLGYLATGLFTVQAHETAIVERFGRPLQTEQSLEPGLHYRLPWPVERVRRVNARRIQRMVVGSEISPESTVLLWTNIHYIRDFNVLSGENIFMDVGMVLEYRVADPHDYLYSTQKPEGILREVAYGVLLRTVAQRTFFELVTTDRDRLEQGIGEEIARELEPYSTGLELVSANLRDLHPPTGVAADFQEVVTATVDYETYVNEAHGYANHLLPRARGQAEVMRSEAAAKRNEKVLMGKGERERFFKTWGEYRRAPELTRRRLLLERLESILPDREKYIVPPEAAEGAVDLLLILNPADLKKTSRARGDTAPVDRQGGRR
jgi:membrane protease subunit HflK